MTRQGTGQVPPLPAIPILQHEATPCVSGPQGPCTYQQIGGEWPLSGKNGPHLGIQEISDVDLYNVGDIHCHKLLHKAKTCNCTYRKHFLLLGFWIFLCPFPVLSLKIDNCFPIPSFSFCAAARMFSTSSSPHQLLAML